MPIPELGPWSAQAACLGNELRQFFYDESKGRIENAEAEAEALAVCHRCPVQTECLAYALEHRIMFGIWGGKTERQRRTIIELARRAGLRSRAAARRAAP